MKATFGVFLTSLAVTTGVAAPAVDFVRDIQPIFAEHCVKCHGPEKQTPSLPDPGPATNATLKKQIPIRQMEQDRIRRFAEKGNSGRGFINGGVYCLRRAAVELLPPGPSSVERDLFPQLAAGSQLLGKPAFGYFIDIGLPETLGQAQAELPGWLRKLESQQAGLSK